MRIWKKSVQMCNRAAGAFAAVFRAGAFQRAAGTSAAVLRAGAVQRAAVLHAGSQKAAGTSAAAFREGAFAAVFRAGVLQRAGSAFAAAVFLAGAVSAAIPEQASAFGGEIRSGQLILQDQGTQTGQLILPEREIQTGQTILQDQGTQTGQLILPEQETQSGQIIQPEQETQTGQETSAAALNIETPHAMVMEVSTGTILYEKDADARVHPASVTKIMTVLLVMEAIDRGELALSDEVVTSAYAKSMGGSQVYLEEGETQTVETLLKCILIASGNDAAVAMAEKVSGAEEAFVEKMNERAQELGMENTHFVDCCGLTDSSDHYTSARDVALMSRVLLKNHPEITEYSGIWMEDITHVTAQGSKLFTLSNTNKLLRAYDGCDGLKTGSTSTAKYCLSATALRDGIRLISVVLTAPDSKTRFSDAAKLLNYGFSGCSLYEDTETPELPEIAVRGAIQEQFPVYLSEKFSYLGTSGEDFSAVEKHLEWKESLEAPLARGDEVGAYVYTLNGREIGRVPVLLAEDAPEAGYADYLGKAWKKWLLAAIGQGSFA